MQSKQKQSVVDMFYVNERWLGGMLTNFKTIQSRIARLKAIENDGRGRNIRCSSEERSYRVKERVGEITRRTLGGIKEMKKIPDAIFIVDPKKERICVQEAHTLRNST